MSLYVVLQIISLTTLVVQHACKGTYVCMAGLARQEVKYVSVRSWCSAQKNSTVLFSKYRTWRRKCFNSSQRCSSRKLYCIIL